ncbi:hypothetical protein [Frateuria soli]|uniref:hypothetical protein n=1 Tax=Frateuria soli TaxID=1542730 RepID=UPI001E5FCFAB|nr:hypothetical protein [Frateuria soli]UGB38162.1 hypothetical protein LQ771_15350 [Frateuria soli]
MNATAHQPCAHPACRCSVPAGDTYCSEHCRQVVDEPADGPCGCGHAPCESGNAPRQGTAEP